VFHYTREYGFDRRERREERRASILVTSRSVYIHKNEKVGLWITARGRGVFEVHRREARVRIRSGGGRSGEVWSFEPPEDPEGWTRDIRAVITSGGGRTRNRRGS